MPTRLLVVEDDAPLARVLCDTLADAGFQVEWASDGAAAVRSLDTDRPDLVLLDAMLATRDDAVVARRLTDAARPPLVVLTARGRSGDEARWQPLQADDYVAKPFQLEDLLARIRAVLRRAHSAVHRLVLGDVVVDFTAMRASSSGRDLHLSPREFDLLRYLAERLPAAVTVGELLRDVWGYAETASTWVVDRAFARLREKLEADPECPRMLLAEGAGWRLACPDGAFTPPAARPARAASSAGNTGRATART